jgi:hypothetical protein
VTVFNEETVTSKTNASNPKPNDPCHPLCATAHVPSIAIPKGTDYLTGWDCQEKRIFTDKGVAPTISGSDGGGGRTGVGYVATASYWDGGQISDCSDCSMLAKGQMMPEKRRFPAVIEPRPATTVDCRNLCENEELSGTLQCKQTGGHSLNYQNPVRIGYAVRRLTPTEALRLQGFPDYWLDIEGMSDTQKYKAVGNSVAIPCVKFVLGGIARVLGGIRNENLRNLQILDTGNNGANSPGEGKTPVAAL